MTSVRELCSEYDRECERTIERFNQTENFNETVLWRRVEKAFQRNIEPLDLFNSPELVQDFDKEDLKKLLFSALRGGTLQECIDALKQTQAFSMLIDVEIKSLVIKVQTKAAQLVA
jgi:hypothetical protein